VRFALDQQQEAFREDIARCLAATSPESEVRRLMASVVGFESAGWSEFARITRGVALQAPAERGGRGGTFIEVAAMLEEAGRALLCAPLLSSVLSTQVTLLADARDPIQQVVRPLAEGRLVATVALPQSAIGAAPEVTASPRSGAQDGTQDGYALDGSVSYVLDGATADRLVVVASVAGEIGFFDVAPEAAGLQRTPLATLDQTRKQARLDFTGVSARRIALDQPGNAALVRLQELTRVAVAAENVGGAGACLQLAVDYARRRHQFGRPIGSFQALKHRLADLLRMVESARSVVFYAARAADSCVTELPTLSRLAHGLSSEAYLRAAEENLQIHGGVGFTWEDTAHLHLKRAKSAALLFGSPAQQRQELAILLGLTG
jgi:alkylation response protein AidB-like acyl-CoA dehydrogenase